MIGKKIAWSMVAVATLVVIGFLLRAHRLRLLSVRQTISIEGAIIHSDADAKKQLPIANVEVTATDGVNSASTRSETSGYFKVVLHKRLLSANPVVVSFRHADYQPLDLDVPTGRLKTPGALYVAAMVPIPEKTLAGSARPVAAVTNIRVRYRRFKSSTREMCPATISLPAPRTASGRLLQGLCRSMQAPTIYLKM